MYLNTDVLVASEPLAECVLGKDNEDANKDSSKKGINIPWFKI